MKKINSLEDLRLEQERLKIRMALTEQAFFEHVGVLKTSTRQAVIKSILLPAGGIILGKLVANAFTASTKGTEKVETSSEQERKNGWLDWINLGMSAWNTFQAAQDINSPVAHSHSDHVAATSQN